MKAVCVSLVLIAAVSTYATVGAAATAPTGAMSAKFRVLKMKDLGGEYKALTDELKKRRPNPDLVAASATQVMELSADLGKWFPKGSGPESRVKMNAKPIIWTSAAEFAALGRTNAAESVKLNAMVLKNDLAAATVQARIVGEACKACHDKFRIEEK
jgi:cytochrome c556